MTITTTQVRSLLLPGLNAIFGADYKDIPTQWGEIFSKHTSDMQYERDVEVKLLGLAQQRSEGQATAFEDMGERYTYVYRHVGIALGFVMTKFAIRDNLYKTQFGPNTQALKRSLMQTQEVYGANILNNANDTTGAYFGGDGQPLLSTQHPIDVGVFANTPLVQAELNETSLQDGVIAIRRFRDAAGLRVLVKPKKLIVTVENQFVAKRLMETPDRVGTSDNDINAIKSSFAGGWSMNDFITNTKSWFITTDVDDGLKYFERDPLEVDMHTDFTTDNLLTKATCRFSYGWSNARAIYGSQP